MKQLTPAMRRSALIAALRDPTTWPDGFKWSFGDCRCCAMGLAWKALGMEEPTTRAAAVFLGIGDHAAQRIFLGVGYHAPDGISPLMIADRLEKLHQWLANG